MSADVAAHAGQQNNEGGTPPLCVGRLSLSTPAGLVARGDDAEVEEVGARTAPWPGPGGAAAAWTARVRAIDGDASIRPAGARSALLDERVMAPNVRVLLRHDARSDPTLRVGEALVDGGTHALWLRVGYDPGREAEVLRYLVALGATYQPFSGPGAPAVGAHPAFCLARGAFVRPFESAERVRVTFDASAWGFSELAVTTNSQGDPDRGPGPIAEWRARIAQGAGSGVGGALVRSGPRTVAGLAGEEVVARVDADGQSSLAFEWASTGAASGAAPYVRITARAPASAAGAQARWDQLCNGLRREQERAR